MENMAEERDAPIVPEAEDNEKKKEEETHDPESHDSDEKENEEESGDEDFFEVEKIISRKKKNGVFLYRVRWKGYPPSNDTWEPVENLDIVADMVQAFDAKQHEKAKSRQEERRLRKLRMEGKKLPGQESSDSDSEDSSKESQLCETTKFFKRLEKDKDLVWAQPDLYSKVKSRAATLSSKKQQQDEQQKEEVAEPSSISVASKPPPTQSESGRGRGGRGRPRGRGGPSGTGRGRGRPKKMVVKSSEEEDGGISSSKPKSAGRGRGRPRKKSEKDSLSDDSSSLSSDSSSEAEEDQPIVKAKLNEEEDGDDSTPLAQLNSSKKQPGRDSSEENKDGEELVSAVKTAGNRKAQTTKKAVKVGSQERGDSQHPRPAAKPSGKGRGRPPKSAQFVESSEDSDADDDKIKGKPKGKPPKKPNKESCEDDGGGENAVPVKPKKTGRGRPPKTPVKDSSEVIEKCQDSAPKGSERPQKDKVTGDSSEDIKASDVTPVKKKKGKGRGRPRKNVLSDTSEDNESDSAAAVAQDSTPVQDVSRMTVIKELSDEYDSPDKNSRKAESQSKQTDITLDHKEGSAEDDKHSALAAKPKAPSKKRKGKSSKKMIIEDSDEEDMSDDSSPRKETPQTFQMPEEKKKKKATKPKKEPQNKKQPNTSSEKTPKKTKTKLEKKISSSNVANTTECQTTPSEVVSKGLEAKSEYSAEASSGNTAEVAVTPLPLSTEVQTSVTKPSGAKTLTARAPGSRPSPSSRAVIPVLEKLAMTSVTNNFMLQSDEQDIGVGESRASAVGESRASAVGENRASAVGENRASAVGESRASAVGESRASAVGESRASAVGESRASAVGESRASAVGESRASAVGESRASAVGESRASAASSLLGSKEEKGESNKSSAKKALSNKKESKETTASQKKSLSKGLKKGLKRKLDTVVEHSRAVKEGGASPAKVASPRPPGSPSDVPSLTKTPTPLPSQLPAESCHAVVNSALPLPPSSSAGASESAAVPSAFSKDVVTDSVTEDIKPVSSPISQKLSTEAKAKSSKSRQKVQSSKSHKSSPRSKSSSAKADKQKSEKEGKSVESGGKTTTHSSVQSTSAESGLHSAVSDAGAVTDIGKMTPQLIDASAKSASVGNEALKPDLTAAKSAWLNTPESKVTKSDSVAPGIARPWAMEKTCVSDQTDPKTSIRAEGDDLKRKHSVSSERSSPVGADSDRLSNMPRTSSTSDLCGPASSGAEVRPPMFRSSSSTELSTSSSLGRPPSSLHSMSAASSPGRSTPTTASRDFVLSPPSKDLPGVFPSPGHTRDPSYLFPPTRDFSLPVRFTSRGSASTAASTSASPRDQFVTASPKDPGSSRDYLTLSRDFMAASALSQASGSGRDTPLGFFPMSSPSSGRESSLYSPSSRIPSISRDGWALPLRPDLNANITGKDLSDKMYGTKSLYGRSLQPSPTEGDRSKLAKGIDFELGEALRTIDLEYVEKLVLAPVTAMELSHDELRQGVIDGNCYLVERALKCYRAYNLDLPDNRGYTLLMNAVLKGYDDIIVHLLTHGASAEVQVKGNTALTLAVEYAECSTVYMLLEMGARVNTADNSGETALFKAVRRGNKEILKLVLDHGADFNWTSHAHLTPLQTARQYRLADIDGTLMDHIQRVVGVFEEEVKRVLGGSARLLSCLFPHRCVCMRDTDTFTASFEYRPSLPAGPSMGFLLFIAHARFEPEVKCRLYGQCAVRKVMLNKVEQLCVTQEPNFVMACHPLITGRNELVLSIHRDPMAKAKLILCAYKTELIQ